MAYHGDIYYDAAASIILLRPHHRPYFVIQFGTNGNFHISASVVMQLKNILSYPNINWKYEVFYVPFSIPFVLVSLVTMLIYRKDMTCSARDPLV